MYMQNIFGINKTTIFVHFQMLENI